MLKDLELFSSKLSKLEGFSDAGDYLVGLVQAKEVEGPQARTAAQGNQDDEGTSVETESKASGGDDDTPADEQSKSEEKKSDDS
jgi:vacuolar protein sorting-associated protein 54